MSRLQGLGSQDGGDAGLAGRVATLEAEVTALNEVAISLAEYGDVSTNTGYQSALLNFPKQIAAEGGGAILLPPGPDVLTGISGQGLAPDFGCYISQSIPLFSNVTLYGQLAYRRNCLIADPTLPRSSEIFHLATPTEAGWNILFPLETLSLEANFALIGTSWSGNEQNRPPLTTDQKTNPLTNLANYGLMMNLAGSSTNGPQSQLWGINDTRGKLQLNLFQDAPETCMYLNGRGEYQIEFNQWAGARVFSVIDNTFDNHTGFNVVNNAGHSGLLMANGNNRFNVWKIWFIGFLPTDNHWGSRDALYTAIASTDPTENPTGYTLVNSFCAVTTAPGVENIEGIFHFQDTYGHGLQDSGKANRFTIYGDMVGGMAGGDFGQVRWTGDDGTRGVFWMAGNYTYALITGRQRDPTKFAGDYPLWVNTTTYAKNDIASDQSGGTTPQQWTYWKCTATGGQAPPGSGTFASYRTANPTVWTQANPAISYPVYCSKVNDTGFDVTALYGTDRGFSDNVYFNSTSRQPNRSQGRLVVNGRQVWNRSYVPASFRITAGIANAIDLERNEVQFDITTSTGTPITASIANARAENMGITVRVRRTPGQTDTAKLTGKFADNSTSGTNLAVNADMMDISMVYMFTPDETVGTSTGRWFITSGAAYTIS